MALPEAVPLQMQAPNCSVVGPSSLPSGLLSGVAFRALSSECFCFQGSSAVRVQKNLVYCCILAVSPPAATAQGSVKHFLYRYPPHLTRCLCQSSGRTPSEFNFPCCSFRGLCGFLGFEVSSSERYNCFVSAKKKTTSPCL